MQIGVIVFPGSNCDRDAAMVTRDILHQPTRMIWHEEQDVSDVDVIIVPGGFSYGDYLRCGAIARFSPAMKATVEHANQGKLVLGICNGFQVLTEVGLLPGALVRNRDLHFICDRLPLRVERTDLPWTNQYTANEVITIPIAHGEGCYFADEATLDMLEGEDRVAFTYKDNPNGAARDIAGILSENRRVLGMMPHPERMAEPVHGGTDGAALFAGLVGELVQA